MAPSRRRRTARSAQPAAVASDLAGGLMYMDPADVRFQHSRIRPFFSGCGRSLDETLQSIQDGTLQPSQLPPIQVIIGQPSDSGDPCFVSLNNRRLWILKQCRQMGLLENNQIAVRIRKPKSAAEAERYSSANCALEATIMRESTRKKEKTPSDLRNKTTDTVDPEGVQHGQSQSMQQNDRHGTTSDSESTQDDYSMTMKSPKSSSNWFGMLESDSSKDSDTDDDRENVDSDSEKQVEEILLNESMLPSSILQDEAGNRNILNDHRSDDICKAEPIDRPELYAEYGPCCRYDKHRAIIDNSSNVYMEVALSCGVTALCAPDVLISYPSVLYDLESDLMDCLRILPRSVHRLIRRTRIWVNASYRYGSVHDPVIVNHTTAHHHPGWLAWTHDRLDKAHGIEIYNCSDYQRMRLHWNGCGLILHELCHIIHQFVLPDGLHNVQILRAYECARSSGLYENVRRRDWAGKDEDYDLAYAMVDCKEFFSEMSVAFWSKGYPELDRKDPNIIISCSPPFMEPTVLKRIQSLFPTRKVNPFTEFMQLLLQRNQRMCNKFYPFTSGQLMLYDPLTYSAISQLWREISKWNDPIDTDVSVSCGESIGCWFAPAARKPLRSFSDTISL